MMDGSWIASLASYGPTVVLCFLLLVTVVRLAPVWKEVRLADDATRKQTAAALALVANAVTDSNKTRMQESAALTHLADVVQGVAVEQRKAIETVRIMQRVQANSSDRLNESVQELAERVAALERHQPTLLKNNARQIATKTPN